MSDETVTVPRELLRQVLDEATENANLAGEWLTTKHAKLIIAKERARIAELRRMAGMEEDHG